jgi:UDP-N-acetylmuramoylalanine--D-glutamate ligase
MYNEIIKFLENKKIAILGFGKEGQSTYHFIRRHLPTIPLTIVNRDDRFKKESFFENYVKDDHNVNYIIGENYLDNLEAFDLIIKSPGVSLKDIDISNIKDKLTSQLGLVLEHTKANVIGITGSKGKSTTTSLIYKVLADQGYDAYLLGNIGIPLLNNIEKFTDKSILVIEMAALQLEYVRVSPHIGLVLNLFEEHLDFFGSPDKYYQAKLKMFEYQNGNDYGFYSQENDTLRQLVENGHYQSKLIPISFSNPESPFLTSNRVVILHPSRLFADIVKQFSSFIRSAPNGLRSAPDPPKLRGLLEQSEPNCRPLA